MVVRHRERDLRSERFGSYLDLTSTPATIIATSSRLLGKAEVCDDVVGNREDVNPFSKSTIVTQYPVLNGILAAWWDPAQLLREMRDFPIGLRPGPTDPRYQFPEFSTAELNEYAWKILAETNPSTPHVGVPAALGEMKDFVGLVKASGEGLLRLSRKGPLITPSLRSSLQSQYGRDIGGAARSAGASFLTWQWVVRPMLDDLRKLYSFMESANKRFQELKGLQEGKTLRRRCHLGRESITGEPLRLFLHSQGYGIDGWRQVSTTSEVWGTAQYKLLPDSKIPSMTDEELKYFARQLAGGFTSWSAVDTAWQLMPWSWMIDWFSNTDDLLAATNNSIGLSWEKISLMRRSKSTATYEVDPATSDSWCTLTGEYFETWERKERWKVFPLIPIPLPHLSLLNKRQFAILASIAVLKTRSAS